MQRLELREAALSEESSLRSKKRKEREEWWEASELISVWTSPGIRSQTRSPLCFSTNESWKEKNGVFTHLSKSSKFFYLLLTPSAEHRACPASNSPDTHHTVCTVHTWRTAYTLKPPPPLPLPLPLPLLLALFQLPHSAVRHCCSCCHRGLIGKCPGGGAKSIKTKPKKLKTNKKKTESKKKGMFKNEKKETSVALPPHTIYSRRLSSFNSCMCNSYYLILTCECAWALVSVLFNLKGGKKKKKEKKNAFSPHKCYGIDLSVYSF